MTDKPLSALGLATTDTGTDFYAVHNGNSRRTTARRIFDLTISTQGLVADTGAHLAASSVEGALRELAHKASPNTTTDNAIARYDGAAGALQNSGVTIDDSNVMAGAKILATGSTTARTLEARFGKIFNVLDYGAVADDATNNATAFSAAYTACAAAGGGIIYIPAGTYRAASFPTIAANNVSVIGDGDFSGGTILRHTAASGDFIVATGQHDIIKGLYFWPTQRKSSGYEIKISGGFRSTIERFRIDYAYNGIFINDSTETYVQSVQFRYLLGSRGLFYGGSTGSFGARVSFVMADNPYPVSAPTSASVKSWATSTGFTAGNVISQNGNIYQCSTSGTSASGGGGPSGFPSGTSPETAFSGTITDGTAVWKFVCNNSLQWINNDSYGNSLSLISAALLNGAAGFVMSDSAASGSSYPQFFSAFDLEADHSFGDSVQLTGGNSALLTNAWVGSSLSGNGITVGASHKGEVGVVNSRIVGASQHGILINSGPVNSFISNNFISNNSASSSGTYHGVILGANASHVSINGNRIGVAIGAGTNNQGYGIFVSAGTTDYLIARGNDLQGNVSGGVNYAGTGTHNFITENPGYNPVGATAAATMGASPFTYTAGPTPETHYVRQSATNTATITQGGQQIATLAGATTYYTIQLGPNESYITTYATTTPTYTKFVH